MKIKVIKIGGKIIDNDHKLSRFLKKISLLKEPFVLVHGGGKLATDLGDKMGLKTTMVDGRRVTDKETLDLITMVYGGLVNKKIVAKLQKLGVNAIGLSGADAGIIQSKKRSPKPVNFGFVGDITNVDAPRIKQLIKSGLVPVLAPLTHDGKGQLLNTNSDSIAAHTAIELAKVYNCSLQYYFEMKGVMNGTKVIEILSTDEYKTLKEEGIIKNGMVPKLDMAFSSLNSGVKSVRIAGHQYLDQVEGGTYLLL